MTDQDPTQRYEPPPAGPPAPPAAFPTASAEDATPAPTAPVQTAPTQRGGSRPKWIVAGVVTLLVAGIAAGATWMLTRDSGSPAVMDWAPADSIVYAELRLDLPGGQEQELAAVMSAFPGFDDQAAFDLKLGEALDQLAGKATDGKHDYQTWIEPWFGGQLSMSMGPLPASLDGARQTRALLLAGVTNADLALAWASALLAESGATSSTERYNGVTITTVTPPGDRPAGMTGAYAVTGPVLALGDLESVKAAIDTNGSGELATSEPFRDALASVTGDRLGFAYVNTRAILEATAALAPADVEVFTMDLPSFLTQAQAPWVAMALRADDDAFVIDARMPHVGPLVAATASTLPAVAPPTTVLLGAWTDVGTSLESLRTSAADDPALGDGLKQVEDALAILGGFDAIVGWMDDAGVAITRDGDAIAGGLLVTPTDAADADRLLTQLKGFVALAGGTSGLKVADEEYAGTTITTITIEDVGALAGQATGDTLSGLPDSLVIAYAVTDEVVTIGYTAEFVKAVVDARTGDSLATTDRFESLLDRVGGPWSSLAWVDVDGLRELVEGMVPEAERGVYDADLRPYLEAFDALIATSVPGEDLDRGTMILRVGGE